MLQNTQILLDRYHFFIKKVVETEIVYTLEDNRSVAVCPSNKYELEEEPVAVLVYWSEKTRALACQKEEWAQFALKAIPLTEFMELWCLGMYDDEVVTGIEFDAQLFGYEELPLQLLKDLIHEVKEKKKELIFKQFSSLQDFEIYLNDLEEGYL